MYEFFLWHFFIFALTFTVYVSIFLYLFVINFLPIIKVLVIETVNGHVNMYLVKTNWEKNCYVPWLAEEKEILLRWFSPSVN